MASRATGVRRTGLALAAALGISVLAALWMRASLEESEALRESLEAAISSQLAVHLEAGELAVSFWPARLRLAKPVLVIPGRGRLTLGEAQIAVDRASLLQGNVQMLALHLAGPALLEIDPLELAAELRLALEPGEASLAWRLEGDGTLASGGRFSLRGGFDSTGGFQGSLELTEAESGPFASLLTAAGGRPTKLAGRYSGSLELAGRDAGAVTLRLTSPDATLQLPPVRLQGPIALVAQLPVPQALDGSGGRFRIDATRARVDYDGGPALASGQGGSVEGRILSAAGGGFRLEEVGLKVRRFRGRIDERSEGPDGG